MLVNFKVDRQFGSILAEKKTSWIIGSHKTRYDVVMFGIVIEEDSMVQASIACADGITVITGNFYIFKVF